MDTRRGRGRRLIRKSRENAISEDRELDDEVEDLPDEEPPGVYTAKSESPGSHNAEGNTGKSPGSCLSPMDSAILEHVLDEEPLRCQAKSRSSCLSQMDTSLIRKPRDDDLDDVLDKKLEDDLDEALKDVLDKKLDELEDVLDEEPILDEPPHSTFREKARRGGGGNTAKSPASSREKLNRRGVNRENRPCSESSRQKANIRGVTPQTQQRRESSVRDSSSPGLCLSGSDQTYKFRDAFVDEEPPGLRFRHKTKRRVNSPGSCLSPMDTRRHPIRKPRDNEDEETPGLRFHHKTTKSRVNIRKDEDVLDEEPSGLRFGYKTKRRVNSPGSGLSPMDTRRHPIRKPRDNEDEETPGLRFRHKTTKRRVNSPASCLSPMDTRRRRRRLIKKPRDNAICEDKDLDDFLDEESPRLPFREKARRGGNKTKSPGSSREKLNRRGVNREKRLCSESSRQKAKRRGGVTPQTPQRRESSVRDSSSPGLCLSGSDQTYKFRDAFVDSLFPHQKEGIIWLWRMHRLGRGAIVSDDMGMGKTMQILAFFKCLFQYDLIKNAIIVCPTILVNTWVEEMEKVGLSNMTTTFSSIIKAKRAKRESVLRVITKSGGILVISYDQLRLNTEALQGHTNGFKWDYMILDEGHLIKNSKTQKSKSVRKIPSSHRIILTGTPLQNKLHELWALFDFCNPGMFCTTEDEFKNKYVSGINRGNYKNSSAKQVRVRASLAKDLQMHMQTFFLRRLKLDVFPAETSKLAKKNEFVVWLRLTSSQTKLYRQALEKSPDLATRPDPFKVQKALLKICNHPALADDSQTYTDTDSCKLVFILSLLENLIQEGHRILVFSQSLRMLDLIQASVSSKRYTFVRIDGKTKAKERTKIISTFQSDEVSDEKPSIFLLSSKVGSLGLTLTAADRVIIVDPDWNPSVDNQAVDRVYRIGQKKNVIVYRVVTSNTLEERAYRVQIMKAGLLRTVTEKKSQMNYFEQCGKVLRLPEEGFGVSPTLKELLLRHPKQMKVDELDSHVKFLESMGIVGVSNHGSLFSESIHVDPEEDEDIRRGATSSGRRSSAKSTRDSIDQWAQFAYNPKETYMRQRIDRMIFGCGYFQLQLLDVARKDGNVGVLNPCNGAFHFSYSVFGDDGSSPEDDEISGLQLFRKQKDDQAERPCTLLTCTEKGDVSLRTVKFPDARADAAPKIGKHVAQVNYWLVKWMGVKTSACLEGNVYMGS